MKRRIVRGLLGALLSCVSTLAVAEDIDLFVDNDVAAGDVPNVLLVLDNGANFSSSASFSNCPGVEGWPTAMANTVGGIEQCALYKVVESLTPGSVNLGVMVFNGSIEGCTEGGDGGCLLKDVSLMDDARKEEMLSWIKTWTTSEGGGGSGGGKKTTTETETETSSGFNIKASSNLNGAVMQEAWALFSGRKGLSGADYSGDKPSASCGSNYVIFVGNSFSSSGSPNDRKGPKTALEGAFTDTASLLMNASPMASVDQQQVITGPIPVSCGSKGTSFTFPTSNHETGGYYADEWARYMKSQGIKTYSVGLLGSSCQPSYEALLKSMGDAGGGRYFPTTDYDELKTALETALSEIQSVNSVFASVSLPVSVNTQGTYLNQVFVGMFRPDGDAKPRWYGNLKQYKLGYDEAKVLRLLDADGNQAISSGDTGFISECARSYWTPLKSDSNSNLYWASIDDANCGGYSAQAETPDGNMVEKGGQGFKLRGLTPSSRNVKTCGVSDTSSCTATLADFNHSNGNITAAAMGIVDGTADEQAVEREALIRWARGENLEPEAIAGKTADEQKTMMRPSSHGDVVHSRPVAINFADSDDDDPEVVVFYGGNDGMLRAVNGNREGGLEIGGKDPGEEMWSFVAPESYGLFARLKADSELIKYPTVTSAGATPKDYGFDGPVAAYKTASEAWVFASMRRGGRMLYAFDVSTPQSPSLKWRVGCNDAGCTSSDFSDIGQTWAVPIVLKSAGYTSGSTKKPMLIMGGGYDTCEDEDPASCDSSSKGRAIYLLDADTGGLLKKFTTDGGVVGDVTVIKDDEGLAQYAYAADLRGNVYRISGGANVPIGSVAPNLWVITKIAKLGGTGTDARKFMFGPDVVVESGVHYLMLGSGDREKPVASFTNATAVQNHFFMIKDQPLNAEWLSSESDNCDAAVFCMDSLYHIPAAEGTFVQSELDAAKGWYLQLDSSEKVVTSALTIFGTVYFSTHQPATAPDPDSEDMCAPSLGDSRSYSINFKNAEGLNGDRYADLVGDGLPPSPVAGLVTLDDGTTVPFCIGCSAESPLEGGEPPLPPSASQPKARVYWNVEQ